MSEIGMSELQHSWNMQRTAEINDLMRSTQSGPLISIPSRNNARINPQYNIIDQQQIQQYQQTKYQPWSPKSSQLPLVSNSNTK
jgi:hypothetical protein